MVAFTIAMIGSGFAGTVDYEFVSNTSRLVGMFNDSGTDDVGRLDRDGVFRPFMVITGDLYSGPHMPERFLNSGETVPQPVYEFRKGVLHPGTLKLGGRFVADKGGVTVQFKDYRYSPSAQRIWNLPGEFRLKLKGEAAKP